MKRKVQIDELRMRTTGLTRTDAQQLAEKVTQRLSEITPNLSRLIRIPEVRIGITAQGNKDIGRLAQGISDQIRRRLG